MQMRQGLKQALRMEQASLLEMPEDEFNRLITEIEKNPLFQRLYREERLIRRQRFPRTDISSDFYQLREEGVADEGSLDVESLLLNKEYIVRQIQNLGLEKLVRETLGPVQVELKPKAKIEEIIAVAPEEIPVHLKQGKAHFEAGHYQEALKEFESILKVAPGNIEARVWLRKTNQKLAEPEIEVTAEGEAAPTAKEAKPKYCVWMSMGMVSYRLCTRNYDCLACEFDQTMQEKMASGEAPELDEALAKFKELPGNQRLCRYAVKGDVSYRLCTRAFQCATCEFGQMMDDALQQKLAKLAVRREALHKKEQKAGAKA